ncbi:MAG: hypothetical protein EYC67_09455 [Betaproteobacteria bacterium]|nr:MAG: hypothetical protein EYC67_09455 [Betaproteobacteria bacterium]
MSLSYEQYLDEVTTLIYERHDLSEKASIRVVMLAQADGFFSDHDDDPSMRTQDRAERDAEAVFRKYARPPQR